MTVFETIQDDLEQGFVKQNRRPKMHAARDEVDIAFGSDFVSGAHRRIKILLIRVTDTYPSPSNWTLPLLTRSPTPQYSS